MWIKSVTTIFILVFSINIFSQNCDCVDAKSEDTTRFGGNELITLIESKTRKSIQGKVSDVNGKALNDVLVEIFDKPEWIKENKNSPPENQKRLFACVTNESGSFSFPKISKGRYEIRFSKDVGWSPTYILIEVDPQNSKASENILEVYLNVGN